MVGISGSIRYSSIGSATPNIIVSGRSVACGVVAVSRARCIGNVTGVAKRQAGYKESNSNKDMPHDQFAVPNPGAGCGAKYGGPHHGERTHDLEPLRRRQRAQGVDRRIHYRSVQGKHGNLFHGLVVGSRTLFLSADRRSLTDARHLDPQCVDAGKRNDRQSGEKQHTPGQGGFDDLIVVCSTHRLCPCFECFRFYVARSSIDQSKLPCVERPTRFSWLSPGANRNRRFDK